MRFRNPTRVAAFLTTGMLVMVACAVGAQQLQRGPGSKSGQVARTVAAMVGRHHIARPPINDAISEKLFKRYLKALDPQKLYLTKNDVTKLSDQSKDLDDQIKAGDVDFAFETFAIYKKRMSERMPYIGKLIDADHDFTKDEEMLIDADDRDWADGPTEIADRWRKRIKYELLSMKLDDTELPEARKRLHKRYSTLNKLMNQTEENEILEIYLSSLTHTLDPHSSYMSPDTVKDFNIAMELKLQGIGASLRSEDGYTIVADVVKGGAADKDGRLKVNDKIIGVDEHADGDMQTIIDMKLKHVVRRIRGDKGTKVRLQVKTETGEVGVYELTRQEIKLEESEVKGEIINIGERLEGRSGRIGVINIPSFYRDFRGAQMGLPNFKSTRRDVEKVLNDFEKAGGVDAVVVDLRYNGGGALSEAVEVSGLFVSKGPIVQVRERDGSVTLHPDTDPDMQCRQPLIVLCNRLSASASEIFAGAIKDYGRGIVVGDSTTHGKGTVQNVMGVRSGFGFGSPRGALKLTINKFYRVNGDSTQKRGVVSDIVLPSFLEHREIGEATLDNALAFDQIRAAARANTKGYVNTQLLSVLKKKSAERIEKSEDFAELDEEIAKFKERRDRKTISLKEATLKAEIAEAKKEAEEARKEAEQQAGVAKSDEIFRKHFYNDEVLNIAVDYVELWKRQQTASR